MSKAVVSVAFGMTPGGNAYVSALQRLLQSLDTVGFDGQRVTWAEKLPAKSPPHSEQPYAFKVHALAHAGETARVLLWLDSSCVVKRPLDPIFELIEQRGVLVFDNPPHNVGEWCTDRALPLLGFVSREEALTVPMCHGGIVGLDMASARAQLFLSRMRAYADVGAFAGPRNASQGRASVDPRVHAHRHDQTAASTLAWRMSIPLEPMGDLLAYPPGDATIVVDKHRTLG